MGNTPVLGGGTNVTAGLQLSAANYTDDNPLWSGTIALTAGLQLQYSVYRAEADGTFTLLGNSSTGLSLYQFSRVHLLIR